jgi:hypothetical protein
MFKSAHWFLTTGWNIAKSQIFEDNLIRVMPRDHRLKRGVDRPQGAIGLAPEVCVMGSRRLVPEAFAECAAVAVGAVPIALATCIGDVAEDTAGVRQRSKAFSGGVSWSARVWPRGNTPLKKGLFSTDSRSLPYQPL